MDVDLELFNLYNQINDQIIVDNFLIIQIIEQMIHQNIPRRKIYRIKKRLNPFEALDEDEFKRRFRFTKNEVHMLYDLLDGANTLEPEVNCPTIMFIIKSTNSF